MPGRRANPEPADQSPTERADVYLLDRRAAREIDRLAVERYAMPSILLMENAALHLADAAWGMVEHAPTPRVAVVCGPGNNGGDGLAASRHLHNAGARVVVLSTADPARFTGDAGANAAIVSRMGLPFRVLDPGDMAGSADAGIGVLGRPDLIIDAVFGTGLDRPVAGSIATLIAWVNTHRKNGAAVLAADIPSGLDADTGEPLGCAVRADVTVTFAGLKVGFTSLAAQEYVGDVVVADIGVPRELIETLGTRLVRHADAQPTITVRAIDRRRSARGRS